MRKKEKIMYTRTHVFKFVNKVSRDSFKFFCINYTDTLFKDGLNFSLFIDVSDISFQFLTVWKSKKEWEKSFKKAGEYSDLKKQITEMVYGDKLDVAKPGCDATEAWMDQVLLRVLRTAPKRAPELFMNIAKAIDGDSFARFMRGHGDLRGRMRLLSKLPAGLFLKAARRLGSMRD